MRMLICAVLVAGAAAFGQTQSKLTVRCSEDCSVKLGDDGGQDVGQKLGPRQWEFTQLAPGSRKIDVLGVIDRPLYSGSLEVKPNVDLVVDVDFKKLTTASEKPLVEPPDAGPPPPPRAGVIHVRCDTDCSAYLDGQRKTKEGKQHDFADVAAGKHAVKTSNRMNTTAELAVDLAPGTEVFLMAKGKDLKLTNSRPLP